jgi:hypothetical protein
MGIGSFPHIHLKPGKGLDELGQLAVTEVARVEVRLFFQNEVA